MLRVAYLFERFPSFGQTFCYREVAELIRQKAEVTIFSIRQPTGEPPQDWSESVLRRVSYLPGESVLVKEIDRATRKGELPPQAIASLNEWGRQSDFLRLYQAAYVGLRLQRSGITRVHAHFAGMAARTAYWINRFFGINYSVTAHANDVFAPRDFVVSLGKIFEAASAIVTVSDFAVAQLSDRFPQLAGKIHRVYNGVDLGQFREANCDTGVASILAVGRLIEKKGFADLISACATLKARGRRFSCKIIGDGPLRETLSAQIADAGLAAEVRLLGPFGQRQIVNHLAEATVFVLPCAIESDGGMDNLPTVILEAMAAGLPVISTPLAGVPEMVQPGVTGILVPSRDPAELAAAIETLDSDREAAKRLGRRGREVAAEKFVIEKNVKSLAAILSSEGESNYPIKPENR